MVATSHVELVHENYPIFRRACGKKNMFTKKKRAFNQTKLLFGADEYAV